MAKLDLSQLTTENLAKGMARRNAAPPRTAWKGYVPEGGTGVSRSQGARQRRQPSEDEPGFNPATQGNKRYGAGATAPFSRSNATKRRRLDTGTSSSRSQGAIRASRRGTETAPGVAGALREGQNPHVEFDKNPKYAGGTYGVYSHKIPKGAKFVSKKTKNVSNAARRRLTNLKQTGNYARGGAH